MKVKSISLSLKLETGADHAACPHNFHTLEHTPCANGNYFWILNLNFWSVFK